MQLAKFAEGLKMARGVLAKEPGKRPWRPCDALMETGHPEAEGDRRASQELDAAPILARVASRLELKGRPGRRLKLEMGEAEAKARKGGGDKAAAWLWLAWATSPAPGGSRPSRTHGSVPPKTSATAALGRIRAWRDRRRRLHYEKAVPRSRPAHARRPRRPLTGLGRADANRPVWTACRRRRQERVSLRPSPPVLLRPDRDSAQGPGTRPARLRRPQGRLRPTRPGLAPLVNNQAEEAAKEPSARHRDNLDYRRLDPRLGDKPKAREHLIKALARNPVFSPRAETLQQGLPKPWRRKPRRLQEVNVTT